MYIICWTGIKKLLLPSKTALVLSMAVGIGVGNYSTIAANKTANFNRNSGTSDNTILATNKLRPTRDKWLWPFASTSPWNMPIGSNARYVPANIQKAEWAVADVEYFYKIQANDPLRSVYVPGAWGSGRCTGTISQGKLPVPDNLIVPDAGKYSTPNNPAAFLLPDGKTLVQLNPLTRCTAGGNVYGWRTEDVSIYGDGLRGGRGGSGLSSIGGSIRLGELTGTKPIRHALKINLWANKYLHYSSSNPGYRWPADRADGYAAEHYKGTNPKLVMGTLLAIPQNVTKASLGLQTAAGRKLFHALQNYGVYVVDDSAGDADYLSVENGVLEEFRATYSYDFGGTSGIFYNDLMKLFRALHIVENNGPNSVGGGGTPRVRMAPPIGN
ncbi:hypothetical protein [Gloeocapsopsis crepidinum]|uniref:hypothetical protein n=1 Tax=Gloeocapsopsis crepidinum TaxID=693223 RepID=UPI003F71D242